MFARIGVMRALNRHVERVFNADRKEHHWGNGSWQGIEYDPHRPPHHAMLLIVAILVMWQVFGAAWG
jgi:hypothetical protein